MSERNVQSDLPGTAGPLSELPNLALTKLMLDSIGLPPVPDCARGTALARLPLLPLHRHGGDPAQASQGRHARPGQLQGSVFWSRGGMDCTVQYSTVPHSTVQYCTTQYSTVLYCAVQHTRGWI